MYPVLNLTHVLDFLDTSGMGVTITLLTCIDFIKMSIYQKKDTTKNGTYHRHIHQKNIKKTKCNKNANLQKLILLKDFRGIQ
jgi:hypothetical protein